MYGLNLTSTALNPEDLSTNSFTVWTTISNLYWSSLKINFIYGCGWDCGSGYVYGYGYGCGCGCYYYCWLNSSSFYSENYYCKLNSSAFYFYCYYY